MYQTFRTALLIFFTLTILTGVIYPAIVTVVAQAVFPHQANGSLIQRDGQKRGSTLIGQSFARPDYFWSRISATSPVPYNAAASGGSNFGPMHPGLLASAKARVAALNAGRPTDRLVPIDLATSSASGLDPHISPAAADFQIARVAAARAISEDGLRELVLQHTEGRTLGLLGEPRVNVVLLNLALDQMPRPQEK